jgi:hypothetical protein
VADAAGMERTGSVVSSTVAEGVEWACRVRALFRERALPGGGTLGGESGSGEATERRSDDGGAEGRGEWQMNVKTP